MKYVTPSLACVLAIASAFILQYVPSTAASGDVTFAVVQATQGAKAYAQNCSSCHGANLQGVSAPALGGKTSGVAQQSVAEVYEYVAQQMPLTAPGSLTSVQYLSIMAYLLQKNGHKAGSKALTTSVASTSTVMVYAP